MMAALRDLPVSSEAFTAIKYSIVEVDGGETPPSPPRKTQRTDASPDVSSSRKGKSRQTEFNGERAKKLILNNRAYYKHPDTLPLLSLVKQAIHSILGREGGQASTNEEVLIATGILISQPHNKGADIQSDLRLAIEQCVSRKYRVVSPARGVKRQLEWLESYVEAWEWYEKQILLLRAVLVELDRVYLVENQLDSIIDMAHKAWAKGILDKGDVIREMDETITAWGNLERHSSKPHSRELIKRLIKGLQTLSEYEVNFRVSFIDATKQFYTEQAASRQEKMTPVAFLKYAEERVQEEEERCRDVIPESTWPAVISKTERCLWGTPAQVTWIVDNALPTLLSTRDTDAIKMMHKRFTRVGAIKLLHVNFKKYAGEQAISIVREPEGGDENMIKHLLDFKAFLNELVRILEDRELGYAVATAFEMAFSSRKTKPTEMMARYIDTSMRLGQKDVSDDEHFEFLKRVLDLYRFTQDKDVFRTFYYRALAKRLLLDRSASDDQEKRVIAMLTKDYDPEFGKGDAMFQDLALSKDLVEGFHKKLAPTLPQTLILHVNVLRFSSWPIARRKEGESEIALPPAMQRSLKKFQEYYKSKHENRTMDWYHSLGTATVVARFQDGKKELTISLYQCVVLLLFAPTDGTLEYADIKGRTGLWDANLKRTLQSLACGKKKVLRKVPPGREVNDNDRFEFNPGFTDSRYKVLIPNIAHQETVEEVRAISNQIDDDRKFTIDAAIVRIMKSKKKSGVEPLKAGVIDAVKAHFLPDVKSIKDRIEKLIEQEYIRRDETDKTIFHYVA